MMRLANLAAFHFMLLASRASAQSDSSMRPLTVPGATAILRCRATPPAPRDSVVGAHTRIEIELVRSLGTGTRSDILWIDSTDAPLRLIEVTTPDTAATNAGRAQLSTFTATFAPGQPARGVHLVYPADESIGTGKLIGSTTELTPSQQRAAGELARWIIVHRCRSRPST